MYARNLHIKTGDRDPVVLLQLRSPDLVALFHALHADAAANPKGGATRHALFPYAVSDKNKLGFVPHITLCKWTDGTTKEFVREHFSVEAAGRAVPHLSIALPVNTVEYKEL